MITGASMLVRKSSTNILWFSPPPSVLREAVCKSGYCFEYFQQHFEVHPLPRDLAPRLPRDLAQLLVALDTHTKNSFKNHNLKKLLLKQSISATLSTNNLKICTLEEVK